MALALDATNTPAVKLNLIGANAPVTSDTFTPIDGSVILVRWIGNSSGSTVPSTPTITDNLGSPLSYTLLDWENYGDPGGSSGQSASWVASVTSGAAMAITVTSGVSGLDRQAALSVRLFTGADSSTPAGAHGEAGAGFGTSSISQSYLAQCTNGWGHLAVCDYDATGSMTAGAGCTFTGAGNGTGTIVGAVSYGFLSRTTNDDSNGSNNTLACTLGSGSNNLTWTYAEVEEAVAGGGGGPLGDDGGTPWPWRSE